ncbi:MAG: cytochrome c family protein [Spirochaetes bacterium]|nr:cytochrome c family protein [Spirochaetota bacterium]
MKRILLTAIALFISYPLIIFSCSKIPHFELSRFIQPEICGGCHDEIYEQWKTSMHNLSHVDELYRVAAFHYLKGLTDPDEIKEAEHCVVCHAPIGYFSGFPKKVSQERDNASKIAEIVKKGVQCDFCHSATGAYAIYNNQMKLDPGYGEANPGIKRGPFKDSHSDFHKSEFSEFHTSSEICGVCHDVRHVAFGTKLETTYEEWSKSPYNAKDPKERVTCQGCHMYHRPGVPATGSTERPKNPGVAAIGGPPREHIFTHYFVGGNVAIPLRHGDALKAKMAEERLKHAARISIIDSQLHNRKIGIIIENIGAGHYLPTGLTDIRQMWLEVVVKDIKGKIIFSSGVADSKGYLPTDTVIFNTVFGDGKGKAVSNIAKAREILKDHRIPPKGKVEEFFVLPNFLPETIAVHARLLYRSASQKLVDELLGEGKLRLPIVVMAEVKKDISVKKQ